MDGFPRKFEKWIFFRKSAKKNQVWLKSEKNKGYLTWRSIYIFYLSCWSLLRMRYFFQTSVVEKIKTHVLCQQIFSEYRAVYEIRGEQNVQPDRPQMTIIYSAEEMKECTPMMFSTYCFYTTIMVTWKRMNVTLHRAFHTVLHDYKHL